jgi:hypothetical protein
MVYVQFSMMPTNEPLNCDYVEQLTFLLFLRVADERSRLSGTPSAIPSVKSAQSVVQIHA